MATSSITSELSSGGDTDTQPWLFTWTEFSGSLGDLGTFLPLVLAMSLVCHLDLGMVLICAGLMNAWSGWVFRQPVPVQPMKAIAAVAIAEGMRSGEIAAAGLISGAVILGLALSGSIGWVAARIPKSVVRGIQLGVGTALILKAGQWLFGGSVGTAGVGPPAGLPWIGWDSIVVASVTAAILSLSWFRRVPILLAVFLGGFVLIGFHTPEVYRSVRFSLPDVRINWPGRSGLVGRIVQGSHTAVAADIAELGAGRLRTQQRLLSRPWRQPAAHGNQRGHDEPAVHPLGRHPHVSRRRRLGSGVPLRRTHWRQRCHAGSSSHLSRARVRLRPVWPTDGVSPLDSRRDADL